MLRFGFLLLALYILPTSGFHPNQTVVENPPIIIIYVETTLDGNANLLCKWTGDGEHCSPMEIYAEGVNFGSGRLKYPLLNKNDTKRELLARIEVGILSEMGLVAARRGKTQFRTNHKDLPLNTFRIIKSTNDSDKCEITKLHCNSFLGFFDMYTYINFVSQMPNYGKPGYGVKDNIQFYYDEKKNEIGTKMVLDV